MRTPGYKELAKKKWILSLVECLACPEHGFDFYLLAYLAYLQAVDELARLGQTMLEVRMDGGTSMGGAGAGGGGEERKRDEPKTEEND